MAVAIGIGTTNCSESCFVPSSSDASQSSLPNSTSRAAAWYEANGQPETALLHARAAADTDQVARLLLDLVQPVWASGRADTVTQWLRWLADEDLLGVYPALTVHGSLMHALLGRPVEAEAWSEAAERSLVLTDLPDGSSMESLLAYLRAFLCRDGLAAMRSDAISGYRGSQSDESLPGEHAFHRRVCRICSTAPRRTLTWCSLGPSRPHRQQAPFRWGRWCRPSGQAIAAEAADWPEATELAKHALSLISGGSFDEYWTSALVFAWGARIAIHSGRIDLAEQHLARVARLRPLLTYALPVVSVQTLIETARAYVALADAPGAQAVLGQARDILRQRPDLGDLGLQVERLRAQLDSSAVTLGGASSLTAAELRVLPFLATPSHIARDRRPPLHLAKHRQVPRGLRVPKAQRLVADRSDRAAARTRPPRRLNTWTAGDRHPG